MTRHAVDVSYPRVTDGHMLVTVSIKDWNERLSFYYPVEKIDNKEVMVHCMWKFGGDVAWLIHLSAEADIDAKDPKKLNLREWRFE